MSSSTVEDVHAASSPEQVQRDCLENLSKNMSLPFRKKLCEIINGILVPDADDSDKKRNFGELLHLWFHDERLIKEIIRTSGLPIVELIELT